MPGDLPLQLRERDREDGREEEARRRPGRAAARSSRASGRAPRAPRRGRGARAGSASPPGSRSRQAAVRRSARAARRARSCIASTSSGGATTPAPVSRIRSAAAPSGGTAARIGRSAARYSKTFPERTPLPRPPASGIRSSSASESRWSSSAAWRGAYGISSSRSPSPRSSAHSRSAERKSPRKRACTSSPDSSSAVRNGRGSRLPKKLPVCVIRKRVARRVVEPGEVVEVAAVRDRHDLPARREAARLVGDRVRDAGDRVGRVGDEPGDALVDLLLRAHGHALGAPVRVRDERVAQVGDPLRAGRLLHRRADEVDRVRAARS